MSDNKSNIDVDKIVKHWIETSDDDLNTMLTLFNSKSFIWSLFLGHISTEKLLKALYVKRFREHAPFTHNLYRLGELIGLEMSDEYSDWFDEITSFNLNARYDEYKKEFYKLCTPEYTQAWIEKIKTIRTWIKEML
ncbi:MAG: HEPN domain-containing protein [Bacteroidetes bacterium]|nr:HEPN domain-containing protein [Bacteroidota bacterium]